MKTQLLIAGLSCSGLALTGAPAALAMGIGLKIAYLFF